MGKRGDDLQRLRAQSRDRPEEIETPGPGQESVWDFPRPPRIEDVRDLLRVELGGEVVAVTTRGKRICETASAPVYYFPPNDVRRIYLSRSGHTSLCEWKGVATYWNVRAGGTSAKNGAFSYENPFPGYEDVTHWIAFYANRMDACFIGDEQVAPQPGNFYAGWVTSKLTGPFKGGPGSERW